VSTVERDGASEDEVTAANDGCRHGNVLAFPTATSASPSADDREAPLREVIGDVLRHERHAQQRTLADVATGAFVSLPYLSEVERGRKEPSSEVLASICAALGIPLADVLERSADRLRARAQRHGGIQLLAA
jgi:DNA-binding XRE family transcriptional regulator